MEGLLEQSPRHQGAQARWETDFLAQVRQDALTVITGAQSTDAPIPATDMWSFDFANVLKSHVAATGAASDDNAAKFHRFRDSWFRERHISWSSARQMAMCASYQQIIGMGRDALPFILAELRRTRNDPDYWFWALNAIAPEAQPVPDESRGKTKEMAAAWIRWGVLNGYLV